ncbi:MAG: hypothetical protein M1820_001244 [Bogoriella megaspora]|nr:MAG: hypothetical protein M1820_001244 [Bogoriella megaspora]
MCGLKHNIFDRCVRNIVRIIGTVNEIDCIHRIHILRNADGDLIDITGINGWGGPDGAWLHGNESGCGGLTDWSWNLDPDGKNSARFNLAPIVKHGCAGRAIGSAGGPQIEC